MIVLKDKTKSICPVCYTEIDAQVIEEDGGVYLIKDCILHGHFKVLIEKDPSIYKKLMNKDFLGHKAPWNSLAISITHLCDSKCNMCYLPQRQGRNLSLQEIQRIVSGYKGMFIRLSGGEPLLRKDLPEVIEGIVKSGNEPVILTNGIGLASLDYARKLKDSGLRMAHFSFNGFSDDIYEKINGQKLLKTKLKALRNLKKAKIITALSITLVKGVNEKELNKAFRYCLKNDSFIRQLRIRSSVHIGRHMEAECLFLSEIVKMLSNIIGVSQDKLIAHSINKGMYTFNCGNNGYTHPCHLELDIFSLLMDELGIKEVRNPLYKKIQVIFKLLLKLGAGNVVKMAFRKLTGKKRLLRLGISVRVWPDKYRVDLGETQRCPSGYVSCVDSSIVPFCYALILNEKNNML